MKIRIANFIAQPDNGSSWALSKVLVSKKNGKESETQTIYPSSLKNCLLRIRKDLRRDDNSYTESIDAFLLKLEEVDRKFIAYIEKAAIDLQENAK